jgi:protein-S-isoprenylcysteine O-methyltransferase Ste14
MFKTIKKDWVFIIPTTLIFFSSLTITGVDFIIFQSYKFKINVFSILGIILFIISFLLRQYCKKVLGKYYSYGLQTSNEHKLIKTGIYKHIRHPVYAAMLIYTPAIPLIFSSLYGFLIMLIIIPFVFYRINIEEKMLAIQLGKEYEDYVKTTKKLIPFLL